MKKIKKFFEKRGVKLKGWIPWSAGQVDSHPRTQSGNLSQLKRAMTMYRDLALACPLVARDAEDNETDHYLLHLLQKPCPWYNKAEFFTKMTEDYFLSGNFYAHIQSNSKGEITGLLPYHHSSIFCYAKTNRDDGKVSADSSDPLLLVKNGYYYQTQFATGEKDKKGKPVMKTSRVPSDEIWHIKNVWQQGADPLNGNSLFTQYPEILDFSQSVLELGFRFADAGGVGPVLISGVEGQDSEQMKAAQQVIEKFFGNKEQFLTLPPETQINEIGKGANANMLQALSSISSLHLARIVGCPIQLVEREDAMHSSGGGQNLKETFRFFLKDQSGKSYLKHIENKLNELVIEPGIRLEFNFRSLMASDLRESAMSLAQLIQSEAVTKEEVRDWLRI